MTSLHEDKLLNEISDYINETSEQHYSISQSGIQLVEFLIQNDEAKDFLRWNVVKYGLRYGRKNGHNRDDLMKMIHYAILLLSDHDKNRKDE